MHVLFTCAMMQGTDSMPCCAGSLVILMMSVTATGADFWLDMMATAMPSFSGMRSTYLRRRQQSRCEVWQCTPRTTEAGGPMQLPGVHARRVMYVTCLHCVTCMQFGMTPACHGSSASGVEYSYTVSMYHIHGWVGELNE